MAGSGAAGELLLDLTGAALWLSAPWGGIGAPAQFSLRLPPAPVFLGESLFLSRNLAAQ